MKIFFTILLIFITLIILFFSYLFFTKPPRMPFIGHFFDKVGYGSLYYLDKPNRSLIYSKKNNINLKLHFLNHHKKNQNQLFYFFMEVLGHLDRLTLFLKFVVIFLVKELPV